MGMPDDWLGRVITEKTELDVKRNKLTQFMDKNPEIKGFGLLARQETAMMEYSVVLGERIDAEQDEVG